MSLAQVLVVLPTAGLVAFYAALFQAMGIPALELHSRKSLLHRTQVLQGFCASSRAVVFSTDLCSKGVSLPGITLLLQVSCLKLYTCKACCSNNKVLYDYKWVAAYATHTSNVILWTLIIQHPGHTSLAMSHLPCP